MKIRLCAFADEAAGDFDGQIAALKRSNIGLIELRNADGKNVADFTLEYAREIKAKMNANGIAVWSIGSPVGKSKIEDDFAFEKKRLNHILDLCGIFGCDKIRIFSFFTNEYDKHRAEIKHRLKEMYKIAKARGITLCHENEKDIYGDTVARTKDLLDNIKELGSIFDPANFLQCGQDIDAAIDLLFDRTDYFHIKDVISKTGELVPAGMGDGKIDRLIKYMKKDYVLTVEPHLKVFAGYANIDKAEMKNKFTFNSNGEAFDCAVEALKKILKENNFKENKGIWVKR